MSDSVRLQRQQPTRLPCSWDSPGKNPGANQHLEGEFLTGDINLEVIIAAAAAAAKSLQSCPTLCDPIDSSPLGSPVPGILQTRTLEWVAISFSNAGKWKVKIESEVAQSCLTLSDPMDLSLPGSSVHGIL